MDSKLLLEKIIARGNKKISLKNETMLFKENFISDMLSNLIYTIFFKSKVREFESSEELKHYRKLKAEFEKRQGKEIKKGTPEFNALLKSYGAKDEKELKTILGKRHNDIASLVNKVKGDRAKIERNYREMEKDLKSYERNKK